MHSREHNAKLLEFSCPAEPARRGAEPAGSREEAAVESAPDWTALMKLAAQASDEVHAELARLETDWRKRLDLQRPLRRKLLGRMCSHITSILAAAADAQHKQEEAAAQSTQQTLGRPDERRLSSTPPLSAMKLAELALRKVKNLGKMDTPTVWEVKNLLRTACLDIFDDAELQTRLQEEQQQTVNGGRRRGRLIDADQLVKGIDPKTGEFKAPHLRHRAVVVLRRLYQEHDDGGRYERALAEQRGVCLKWISATMLLLIIGISAPLVMYGLEMGETDPIDMSRRIAALLVILSAGMLGSLLALLLKFRDVFHRICEMTAHWSVLPAQATVGATLALTLFLVYRTGFIALQDWPNMRVELVQLAAFSLAAGFSEPFVLNIIQRIEKMVH